MQVREQIPLASLTTFRIGGPASVVCECETQDDIQTALALARERGLSVYPLGQGSNVLAEDGPIEKLILRLTNSACTFEDAGNHRVRAIADAGMPWDALVDLSVEKGLWGLENLAGIPGTVGAAPVQNIGAYGREVNDTLEWVEVFDMDTGTVSRLDAEACDFGYRESRFKRERNLLITRVTFVLSTVPAPRIDYLDLAALAAAGMELATPVQIAAAVREVRSHKFPDLRVLGTAGSFFKNPVIARTHAEELAARYPGLPVFPVGEQAKIPIAWILDHVLNLRGFRMGDARLFERHTLVVVTESGAMKQDVDTLAEMITQKVLETTNITIEREVQTLA